MARKCKYSHSSFICLIVSWAAVEIALLHTQLKAGIAIALNIDKTARMIAASTRLKPFFLSFAKSKKEKN